MSPSYEVNVLTHNAFSDPAVYVDHLIQYRSSLTGMFTNNGGDILAFTKFTDHAIKKSTRKDIDDFSTDWPHVQFMPLDAYVGNFEDSMAAPPGNYVSPMVALSAPFSRGNVTITSTDTKVNPDISPNWLLDPRDQEMAVAAFKLSRKIMTQKETSPVVVGEEVFPGLSVDTDAQILATIQRQAFPVSHGSCTCAMGPRTNKMAVVDQNAKVYGVQGLRVVDASAFPVLPPGTPSQTVCE
jgi:choline dehydrogenase-like flavoprotein